MITNLTTPVNGATTFRDYLSIFTTNYKDSPYIVNVTFTVTSPVPILIYVSTKIYLNPYLPKYIVPPDNNLKYVKLTNTDNL